MDSQATYGVSKRGKKTLLYRGFEFWFHKELKNGSVVWRCCKGQALKCKAMVISRDLVVAGNKDPSHSQTSEKRTTLSMAPLLKNASNCKQREVDSSDEVDSMKFSVFTYLKKSRLCETLRFLPLFVLLH